MGSITQGATAAGAAIGDAIKQRKGQRQAMENLSDSLINLNNSLGGEDPLIRAVTESVAVPIATGQIAAGDAGELFSQVLSLIDRSPTGSGFKSTMSDEQRQFLGESAEFLKSQRTGQSALTPDDVAEAGGFQQESFSVSPSGVTQQFKRVPSKEERQRLVDEESAAKAQIEAAKREAQNAKEFESLVPNLVILKQELSKIPALKDTGKLSRAAQFAIGKFKKGAGPIVDPAVGEFTDISGSILGQISRLQSREGRRLSDQDVKRVEKILLRLPELTQEGRQNRLENIDGILEAAGLPRLFTEVSIPASTVGAAEPKGEPSSTPIKIGRFTVEVQ